MSIDKIGVIGAGGTGLNGNSHPALMTAEEQIWQQVKDHMTGKVRSKDWRILTMCHHLGNLISEREGRLGDIVPFEYKKKEE